MGTIFSRKNKKGETFYIQYSVNGEQIREKVGSSSKGVTRRMAKEALMSREGDIVQGKFNIAQTRTYPKFSVLVKSYLEWSENNKRSYRTDKSLAKTLKHFFGNKRIDNITALDIERYKRIRRNKIKEKPKNLGKGDRDISFVTINRELAFLKHFYTMAIKWGKINHNPVMGVKMFPEKMRDRFLNEDEISALLDACELSRNRHLKLIVITALNTGARLREILNLRVVDLDFRNSVINLEFTKTGEKDKVPMTEFLKAALLLHLEEHDHYYLFCDEDGNPFNEVKHSFKTALDIAEITDFRFHDLRHTFASHLAMNGIEGRTLQELGRWKTPSMVMRYAHLSESHKKSAIDKLSSMFKVRSSDMIAVL
jgi:integrase